MTAQQLALIIFALASLMTFLRAENAPLNHYQVIGTHNSYHIAPRPAEEAFIRLRGEAEVAGLQYTHPPLAQQYAAGIRQIELDLFPDPKGGKYAQPAVFQLAKLARQAAPEPLADPEGLLQKPGTKVLHFPNFDFRSNVLTLTQALEQTRAWSQQNPQHHPILILLELKGSPDNWQPNNLLDLEKEILTTLERKHLLTPDEVRGDSPDLRTAVLGKGWPLRDAVRGKLMLALDNTGAVRTNYLQPDPLLKGRLLFPSCPSAKHPSAGFFKVNDPVGQFETIRALSQAGFLIRTRADASTREARANDPTRREKAFAAGAHFISTDFPQANPAFSPYQVTLPQQAEEAFQFRK